MRIAHISNGRVSQISIGNTLGDGEKDVSGTEVGIGDLFDGTTFSRPAETPRPDVDGFIAAMKAAFGGIVAVNALMRQYPTLYPALTTGQWSDAAALIADAKNNSIITAAQYSQVQAALSGSNIPVTLP